MIPTLTIVQSSVGLGDPHICSDFRDRRAILLALYESLVQRLPDGSYGASLALEWHTSDARVWEFQLREGVRCHNGDLLEAADVVASLERVCDPALGGEWGTQGVYLSYLAGSHFEAINQQTVRITLPHPLADLLDLLVDMPIIPRRALPGIPATPVGSGPYRLVEASDRHLVMAWFEAYHGPAPLANEVVWIAAADPSERAALLMRGEADIATHLTITDAAAWEASGGACVRPLSGLCVIAMLNAAAGACADPRVRQALNYALDLPAIMQATMQGEAELLNGPLSRLHLATDPDLPIYPFDQAKARMLLAEAGTPDLQLTMHIPTEHPDESLELAELLSNAWAAVGITTTVVTHADRPGYAEMVRNKQIDDACLFDSSPLSSMRVLREKIHSQLAGPWWQGYRNHAVDLLIDRACATVNNSERQQIYRQAYRSIHADAPWIFLYSPQLRIGLGPRLRDWQPRMDGVVRLFA
ncbi:MAG: ABC transporter substrate-binding protein [Roseiflexaceae bacterium]